MLDTERIAHLLENLSAAQSNVRESAIELSNARENLAVESARTLQGHEFVGKNAEAREREATILIEDDPKINGLQAEVREAIRGLAIHTDDLELTRTEIGLWKALAYQVGGLHS
jgi:hypothetical protein